VDDVTSAKLRSQFLRLSSQPANTSSSSIIIITIIIILIIHRHQQLAVASAAAAALSTLAYTGTAYKLM